MSTTFAVSPEARPVSRSDPASARPAARAFGEGVAAPIGRSSFLARPRTDWWPMLVWIRCFEAPRGTQTAHRPLSAHACRRRERQTCWLHRCVRMRASTPWVCAAFLIRLHHDPGIAQGRAAFCSTQPTTRPSWIWIIPFGVDEKSGWCTRRQATPALPCPRCLRSSPRNSECLIAKTLSEGPLRGRSAPSFRSQNVNPKSFGSANRPVCSGHPQEFCEIFGRDFAMMHNSQAASPNEAQPVTEKPTQILFSVLAGGPPSLHCRP